MTVRRGVAGFTGPAAGIRRLDPRGWYKPLDVGEAGVAASVNDRGRLLVVTLGHPIHGQVQLTTAPQLPSARRYDQGAVRAYRRRLSARSAPSFGLRLADPALRSRGRGPAWLWHETIPLSAIHGVEGAAATPQIATVVPHPADVGGARTLVQVRLPGPTRSGPLRWGGRVRLDRAPYPQLTEGGPLPSATRHLRLERSSDMMLLGDDGLGVAAAIGGDLDLDHRDSVASLRRGWVTADITVEAGWQAIGIALGSDPGEAREALRTVLAIGPEQLLRDTERRWMRRWEGWSDDGSALGPLARRGLAYAVGCCAVSVDGGMCLITDHRLLPLAWTRDGYYVARAFLDWSSRHGVREPAELVRGHLDRLFHVADRPQGWWARSHLIGGQRKDGAFQADQQLYPLLELADYTSITGDPEPIRAYADQLPIVLASLDVRADLETGLFGTDETPADDPVAGPYIASTQILAWRTFTQIAALGIGGSDLVVRAARLRRAIDDHLVTTNGGRSTFAYAVDGRGRAWHDHDANDMPLALAAEWGFCAAGDPVWAATMESILSPRHAGYFDGPIGGLGSVHTPGPWPLGQLQAVIAGSQGQGGDGSSVDHATDALLAEAQWDGTLPEASDSLTGRPISRPKCYHMLF